MIAEFLWSFFYRNWRLFLGRLMFFPSFRGFSVHQFCPVELYSIRVKTQSSEVFIYHVTEVVLELCRTPCYFSQLLPLMPAATAAGNDCWLCLSLLWDTFILALCLLLLLFWGKSYPVQSWNCDKKTSKIASKKDSSPELFLAFHCWCQTQCPNESCAFSSTALCQ